jgi:hypothetical protein
MTPETESPPDPATPESRLELARSLLVWSIHAYEMAQHQWSVVRESYPHLARPKGPDGAPEYREHRAWMSLLDEADNAFNAAELLLAERIEHLYDWLAAEGRRTTEDETAYFQPRAVRHRGTVYVLAYQTSDHEPKTGIIATYRERLIVDVE